MMSETLKVESFISNETFIGPDKNIRSILILDNDRKFVHSLTDSLGSRIPNCFFISCNCPLACLEKFNSLFFDLYIIEQCLPKLPGHEMIQNIRKTSPSSFIIGMTGNSLDDAFTIHKGGPDMFFDKSKSMEIFISMVRGGLDVTLSRRKSIFDKYYNEKEDRIELGSIHWRKREEFNEAFGCSPTTYNTSKRIISVLTCLSRGEEDWEQIASLTGFECTIQRMKAEIRPYLKLISNKRVFTS
jgi:DNA-binding response OmpR family regulator